APRAAQAGRARMVAGPRRGGDRARRQPARGRGDLSLAAAQERAGATRLLLALAPRSRRAAAGRPARGGGEPNPGADAPALRGSPAEAGAEVLRHAAGGAAGQGLEPAAAADVRPARPAQYLRPAGRGPAAGKDPASTLEVRRRRRAVAGPRQA